MFYYLKGRAAHLAPNLAVIDCGGVGYACRTTSYTLSGLQMGQEVTLYTHLNVREDAMELYGFSTQVERSQAVTPRVTIRVRPLSSSGTSTTAGRGR